MLQSPLSFEKQLKGPLARDFRIVSYERRGHGDSDKPAGPQHYLDGGLWGDDLAAVIAGAGLRRPVLVGWSMAAVPIGN